MSLEQPKVSVIMPVRNCVHSVVSAVFSVLQQTEPDLELLIADDHSDDGTAEILQTLPEDPRVRGFRFEQRLGQAALRNALVSHAKAEYLMPCDGDDLMLPWNIGEKLAGLRNCAAQTVVVYGDIVELPVTAEGVPSSAPRLLGSPLGQNWIVLDTSVNHGGSLFSHSAFAAAGGYDAELPIGEDWHLIARLSQLGAIEYLAGRPGYVWFRHPSQTTSTATPEQRAILEQKMLELAARLGKRGQ